MKKEKRMSDSMWRVVNVLSKVGEIFNIPKLKHNSSLVFVTSSGVYINDRMVREEDYDIVSSRMARIAVSALDVGLEMTLEDMIGVINDVRSENKGP